MANHLVDDMTDDEDFAELIAIHLRAPRVFRERPNHFTRWNDREFKDRFRLSKPVVDYIINKISDNIVPATLRNHALSPAQMVFATLRFLATGSMLFVIGDLNGIDKATTSRVIKKVVIQLARLAPEFIAMPTTDEEIAEVRQGFYNIARFPRCIGALDCTHIKIKSPGGNNAELFRNRKNFFSYNVQGICDADLIVRNIVCRWHGSAHDSTIFRNSRLRTNLENGTYSADSVVVGDSGYALRKYLITPLANPETRAEHLFNEAQIRTRNPIERCFGAWKRRFPILALGIRLNKDMVEPIVMATAVLHNIARQMSDDVPRVTEEEEAAIELTQNVNLYAARRRNRRITEHNITRHMLIDEYFQRLLEE